MIHAWKCEAIKHFDVTIYNIIVNYKKNLIKNFPYFLLTFLPFIFFHFSLHSFFLIPFYPFFLSPLSYPPYSPFFYLSSLPFSLLLFCSPLYPLLFPNFLYFLSSLISLFPVLLREILKISSFYLFNAFIFTLYLS